MTWRPAGGVEEAKTATQSRCSGSSGDIWLIIQNQRAYGIYVQPSATVFQKSTKYFCYPLWTKSAARVELKLLQDSRAFVILWNIISTLMLDSLQKLPRTSTFLYQPIVLPSLFHPSPRLTPPRSNIYSLMEPPRLWGSRGLKQTWAVLVPPPGWAGKSRRPPPRTTGYRLTGFSSRDESQTSVMTFAGH